MNIRLQSLSTLSVPFHSSEFVCTSFCMCLRDLHLGGGTEGDICPPLARIPPPHLGICKQHHAHCITVYCTLCYTMLHHVTPCYTVYLIVRVDLGNVSVFSSMHTTLQHTTHCVTPCYTACYTVLHCMLHCMLHRVTLYVTLYLIVGMDLGKRLSVVSAPL